MRRSLVLLVLAAGVLAACPSSKPAHEQAAAAAPVSAAGVRVLEAGRQPRRALRYTPKPPLAETLVLTTTQRMEVGGQTIVLPAATMRIALSLTGVASDGSFSLALTIGEMALGQGADPLVAAQLKQGFAELRGATGSARIGAHGEILDLAIAAPTPDAEVLLESLKESLRNAFVLLPDEPVGPGAVWTATHTLTVAGVQVSQEQRVTLGQLGEHELAFTRDIQQSGAAQALRTSGLTIAIERYTGQLVSEGRVDLTRVAPPQLHVQADSTMIATPEGGARLTNKVGVTLDFKAEAAP